MMKIRAIGDVHGKYNRYHKIISKVDHSIALGDIGYGFKHRVNEWYYPNPSYDKMVKHNAYFIRGNHDNPLVCRNQRMFIPDGTMHHNIFCLGGAVSIDKAYRMEGYDWWPDEELSNDELADVIDRYEQIKPDVIFAHEVPEFHADYICRRRGFAKKEYPSRTRRALEVMFNIHRPSLYVHGHWHYSYRVNVLGTEFIGLNELEYIDLDF